MIVLSELCRGIVPVPDGASGLSVSGVVSDSRKAIPGSLFVAIHGFKADGKTYAADAAGRGACAVVSETDCPGLAVPVLRTDNARRALATLAVRFYGSPADGLMTVGITGTNGKTTVSFLVEAVLLKAGFKTGLVGTILYRWPSHEETADRTTPESVDLQRMLRTMADTGACAVVMEVSSHSLALERVTGLSFQAAVFTNLTRDHLDFHGDLASYGEAKARLFGLVRPGGVAVLNADDPASGRMLRASTGRAVTFGRLSPSADYRIDGLRMEDRSTRFDLVHGSRRLQVSTPLWGDYNAVNAATAAVCGLELGLEENAVVEGIAGMERVPGRMEGISSRRGVRIVVDYAHTPDALENVLRALRGFTGGRIITVFGCGGDRDRGKRPEMGRIASVLSDLVFLTSDNPRTEDPDAIAADVLSGVPDTRRVSAVPDREDAIRAALDEAAAGDTVLVAGKGHEAYQEILGIRHPFNDRKAVEACLMERGEL